LLHGLCRLVARSGVSLRCQRLKLLEVKRTLSACRGRVDLERLSKSDIYVDTKHNWEGQYSWRFFVTEYERWETRYATPDYAFGKEPNYFLRSCKSLLPPAGRALAVADGEGRNGVWLAEQGLDVVSIDFSPSAQRKAKVLAAERHVKMAFELVDVHNWSYPEADFDVVVEIFTQFSSPAERALKWSGMKRSLKSGGLLIIQGYTPKQLEYGTGGPKQIENLYTRAILERAFREFRELSIVEEECEIHEGTSHGGMSAVINLTATKP
jgi:SAM-dependent methyltransferase